MHISVTATVSKKIEFHKLEYYYYVSYYCNFYNMIANTNESIHDSFQWKLCTNNNTVQEMMMLHSFDTHVHHGHIHIIPTPPGVAYIQVHIYQDTAAPQGIRIRICRYKWEYGNNNK